VAHGVLHEVAHDLLEQPGVTGQLHRLDGAGVDGDGRRAQRRHRGVGDVVEVHGREPQPRVVRVGAGQEEELVDEPFHPGGLVEHVVRAVVASAGPVAVLRGLELHAQARDRAAQLMGGVGDEASLVLDAELQPPEHLVDGTSQPTDLVLLRRRGHAQVETLTRDRVGPGADRVHGRKRTADGQPHHGREHADQHGQADAAHPGRDAHRVLHVVHRDCDEHRHRSVGRVDSLGDHAVRAGRVEREPRHLHHVDLARVALRKAETARLIETSGRGDHPTTRHHLGRRLGVLHLGQRRGQVARGRQSRDLLRPLLARIVGGSEELGLEGDHDQQSAQCHGQRDHESSE